MSWAFKSAKCSKDVVRVFQAKGETGAEVHGKGMAVVRVCQVLRLERRQRTNYRDGQVRGVFCGLWGVSQSEGELCPLTCIRGRQF